MLIDLHAHSSGISTCCRIALPEMLQVATAAGLDGVALTNHYQKSYLKGETPAEFAARYLAEYREAQRLGAAMDCKVFFGIEVTMEPHDRVHMLIYGVEEDFVTRYPTLYDYTQPELYRLAHENGGFLVQAHPMRNGKSVLLDTAYLDGVEVNSHPKYDSTHFDELAAIARRDGLILTSGGDFHNDTHRPHCGVYLPDHLTDTRAILTHLQSAKEIRLCAQEPQETQSHNLIFRR